MLNIKNPNQQNLIDTWSHMGQKVRNHLENSWAGFFRQDILPILPVLEFSQAFHNDYGRPSKELHTALGAALLQQLHDLTDEETQDALAFNMQWHYALNIGGNSDAETYICSKTLYNTRQIIIENDLEQLVFDNVRDEIIEKFDVNTDKQRIDSKHIKSNMKNLGRIRIFTHSINKFLRNLKKTHKDLMEIIDEQLVEKYNGKESMQCFSMVKPSKSQKTLKEVSADLFSLTELFKERDDVQNMHSFKLLTRVLNDQCEIVETDGKPEVKVKKPKDVPSDSLQNPSDPDASYSGHKGQGYQVQVMETFQKDKDKNIPNVITYAGVEPAHNSDANALMPAIEKTAKDGVCPEEVLGDTLYGSDDNHERAQGMGVDLVAPLPSGNRKEDRIHLNDFEISDDGDIIACPEGQPPKSIKKNRVSRTLFFHSDTCENCNRNEMCPVKQGRDSHFVNFPNKDIRLAKRRQYEQTDEFKDRYRMRAGVEATMSEYDRKTGVGRMRVRGLESMRFCAMLKAAGINILRAARAQAARLRQKYSVNAAKNPLPGINFVFKEQIGTFFGKIGQIFGLKFAIGKNEPEITPFLLKLAA